MDRGWTGSKNKALPLASLRLSPLDAADLRWYLLGDYAGDLGIRSNIGPTLEFLELQAVRDRPSHKPVELDEGILRVAGRLRRLARRWEALDPHAQAVLRAAYGGTRRTLPEWGDLGPLLPLSARVRAAYGLAKSTRSLEAWLARLVVRPAAAALVADLRRCVESQLVSACRAWEATRRRQRV